MSLTMRQVPNQMQAKRSREVPMTRSQQMAHDLFAEKFQRQLFEFVKMCATDLGEDSALDWRIDPRTHQLYLLEGKGE